MSYLVLLAPGCGRPSVAVSVPVLETTALPDAWALAGLSTGNLPLHTNTYPMPMLVAYVQLLAYVNSDSADRPQALVPRGLVLISVDRSTSLGSAAHQPPRCTRSAWNWSWGSHINIDTSPISSCWQTINMAVRRAGKAGCILIMPLKCLVCTQAASPSRRRLHPSAAERDWWVTECLWR